MHGFYWFSWSCESVILLQTGTLEGQHFRKTGKLVSLSEQQLVDCDIKDSGCLGGMPFLTIDYIASNGGIDTENAYPYKAAVSHAFNLFFFLYICNHLPSPLSAK